MKENFFEFTFSLKRIFWTLLINLGAAKFYYNLINGTDWFVSKRWIAIITIGITTVVIMFWVSIYNEFKAKKTGV